MGCVSGRGHPRHLTSRIFWPLTRRRLFPAAAILLIYCGAMSQHRLLWLSSVLAFAAVACGGAAVPQQELTSAKAAVAGAEVGGAAENPKAALHLQLAKQQIAEAEKLIEEGDNEEAARVITRAQADADLALALAKENKAKLDAQNAKEQLERLQKKAQ
jgi:hypothetical protein